MTHLLLISNYKQETEYKKLLDGESGINVMYHYQALVMVNYMSEWTNYIFTTLKELLNEQSNFDESLSKQFYDVTNYSLGVSFNPLGRNRMSTNPKYKFYYDIDKWLHIKNNKALLTNFKSPSEIEIEFRK